MPLNKPKPRRNKNIECQQFSRDVLVTWQERLEHASEHKQGFLELFQASTQQGQLSALKTIGPSLAQPIPARDTEAVLCTLVEVHSQCASRHPLQRAIASLLQSQSVDDSIRLAVKEHIGKTLETVLGAAGNGPIDTQLKAVHYFEVLMENFPLGLETVESHLPLMLHFIVSIMVSYKTIQQAQSASMAVLLALIKTTTSLLLKTSLRLHRMLTEDVEEVCWPRDCQEKGKWIGEKLAYLIINSEEILAKSDSMPHDMTVSAAMLLVATLNITLGLLPSFRQDHFAPSQLVHRIQRYWLSFSPFARLSLCHALLAKLPIVVVTNVELEEQPLLVALFQHITTLSNSLSESSSRYIASRTLALWTSVARECVRGTEAGSPLSLSLAPSGPIMQTLLQYIWSLWEDPIDGIRHQCRDMFENIIKTYKHLQQSGDFLLELAETLLYTDAPTRGRYILLSSLSPHVSPKSILRVSPRLPQQLMAVMGHQALACHAGDLWSRLVALHWSSVVGGEKEETKWSEVWLLPLVSTMCGEDQLALKHITQHCLPTLFQCSNKSLHLVMAQFKNTPEDSGPSSVLTAQLACFRSAKAYLKEGLTQLEHLYSPEDIFKKAMGHADEQVRLSALGLLCESRRTTEAPQPHLLPHLFSFLELNANSQAPGFRYSVLTSVKKLFIRIRDSCYALSKAFQKSRGRSENPDKLVAKYQDFLGVLLKQHFGVLHPLSSFQRRHFSLSLLQTMSVIFSPVQDTTIPPIFDFTVAVSGEHARTLIECLRDPFDANRVMCLELLYKLDTAKMGLNEPDYLLQCVQSYVSLTCSPKSVNCTSASYLLKLLTRMCCVQFNTILSQQLGLQAPLLSTGEDPLITTLLLLCQLLRDHMTSAKANLVQASISFPMYGLLQSIRTLLETLKPTAAARDVVRGVVDICVQISAVVSPVVCSSSPEGFLPSQEKEIGLLSQSTVGNGNAQSLLLCCWHSMKEISLLLGFLAGELPVISDTKEGMLSQHQVEMISEVFIHQLTEARHRGAFEIAYTGFCKLCRCLWSSPYPSLSKKPLLWIQDLLDSLQTSSMARLLSITRRSAGLPFYVQAILTSEPSYTGYSCLKYTLQTLLKVARSGLSSSVTTPTDSPLQSEPAAVHALNILRSLYRESKLGDLVVPFIPEGVMIAIEGFSASLWPVRNSSTLLFSALFSRVFGAKRVQDEHSMENKMTAREFFTRFPALYDFLLDQLRSSATELLSSSGQLLQPSLFPSLLLLSRLYPSPLDNDHTPYSLHLFIPYLLTCTRCPVWKTRVLVSRALSSLTTPSNLPLLLTELYDRLNMADQNCLHGSLLTLRLLLTEKTELLCAIGERAGWMLDTHLEKSYIASIHNPCGLTAHLYLDILHSLLELTTPTLPSIPQPQLDTVKTLLSSSYKHCFKTSNNDLFSANLTEVHFRLLLLSANHYDKFKPVLIDCPNLEVNELLCTSISTQSRVLRQHGLKALCSVSRPLTESDESRNSIIARVLELVQLETDSETLTKAYQFLAKDVIPQQDAITKVFPIAHQLCLKPTNTLELRLALIQFISKAVSVLALNKQQILIKWISYLKEVSVPTQPFEIRQCVAKQLAELWVYALGNCAPLVVLCNLIVALLQDSDEDVRTQAAQAVTKILSEGTSDCESMQPSQALRMFISHALPKSEISFDVLISLLSSLVEEATLLSILNKHTSTKDVPSQVNNILFDEDPINDYAEDVLVMRLVVNALTDNGPFSVTQLSKLADVLPNLVDGGGRDKGKSPWEDLGMFKTKTKLTILAPLFEAVRLWISKETCTSALSECLCFLDELSLA